MRANQDIPVKLMKVEYLTPGMQREQVKPLHAAYVTKGEGETEYHTRSRQGCCAWAWAKEGETGGEDGVGWAVVPEPPFLSRPSSSFFFLLSNSRSNFDFFFFLVSNGLEGGCAAGCCARGRTCVAGASVAGGCGWVIVCSADGLFWG